MKEEPARERYKKKTHTPTQIRDRLLKSERSYASKIASLEARQKELWSRIEHERRHGTPDERLRGELDEIDRIGREVQRISNLTARRAMLISRLGGMERKG